MAKINNDALTAFIILLLVSLGGNIYQFLDGQEAF